MLCNLSLCKCVYQLCNSTTYLYIFSGLFNDVDCSQICSSGIISSKTLFLTVIQSRIPSDISRLLINEIIFLSRKRRGEDKDCSRNNYDIYLQKMLKITQSIKYNGLIMYKLHIQHCLKKHNTSDVRASVTNLQFHVYAFDVKEPSKKTPE